MALYTAIERQTIQPNADAIFTLNPIPCNRGFVRWRPGYPGFILAGKVCRKPCGCFPRSANYSIHFDGNIAISEGGTVEPISIAIALDGSAVPASQMISTPAAAEEFNAVSKNIEVDIWSGCCETITIRNISNQAIDLENAVIEISRPDLTVTL